MTIVANTFTTFAAIGNREDLVDKIWNVSAVDTPFMASIDKVKATATLHEWQTDILAAAATNAQLQGDDVTFSAVVPTVRLTNRTQNLRKDCVISGTQDAVSKAGRKREITYQLLKKNKELNRDLEFNLTQINVKTAGNSSAAPYMAALENWYDQTASAITTSSRGTNGTGSTSGQSVVCTDGTQRALTESLLKTVIQNTYTNGGEVDLIMAGPFNKTVISGFTGNSTRIQDSGADKKLVAAINVYESDFGVHRIRANRFQRERTVHCLQTDLWALATLRPKQTHDLAKTGDAEKAMIITEVTLESRNDSGSGAVADLTTS